MEKSIKTLFKTPKHHLSPNCCLLLCSYSKCLDVEEIIDNDITRKRHVTRRYLLDVIKRLRYPRQGIALQGRYNNDNFIYLVHLLGTNDEIIVKYLGSQIGYKYKYHDSQSKTLNITFFHVLHKSL